MNICLIGPQVMKTVSGGVSTQVDNIASSLKRKGIEVTFFNPWETYDWGKIDLAHIFRADLETYSIAQWLHESRIPFAVSPVFYNMHKPVTIRLLIQTSRMVKRFIAGVRTDLDCVHDICQYSNKVLPNTYAEKKFIEKGIGIKSEKIKVTPNGVEERFANADPSLFTEKYGLKDFILSVGNFGYKRKNMLNLIYALEKIDHPAVLIGTIYNNSYGNKCREIMQKSSNILWLDALDHNNPLLASAYAASRVFALPSYFETPGLTALEAALAGPNIVITPFGGTKEYFGNMAEYVNPRDISSIEHCIIRALQKEINPELKKHIFDTYTYPVIIDKLITAYQGISNEQT